MPETVPLRVQMIAQTQFTPPADVPWETDVDGGQALAEFAGRACYQSWDKPNPATATNAGYLRHILEVGHLVAVARQGDDGFDGKVFVKTYDFRHKITTSRRLQHFSTMDFVKLTR